MSTQVEQAEVTKIIVRLDTSLAENLEKIIQAKGDAMGMKSSLVRLGIKLLWFIHQKDWEAVSHLIKQFNQDQNFSISEGEQKDV